jgi:outer membrane protein assembly factor BamA
MERLQSSKAMSWRRTTPPVNHKILVILALFILNVSVLCYSGDGGQDHGEGQKDETKNDLVLLPIAYYTPLTKIAGGLGGIYYLKSLEDRLKGSPSTIFVDLIYTQRKQIVCEVTPSLYFKEGNFHLTGYLGFKDFADKFYGIGSGTTEDREEDFEYQSLKINVSLRKRYGSCLYLGLQYDFESFKPTQFQPGGILDSGSIGGSEGGNVSGLGGIFIWDSRDDVFFPTKGMFFQAAANLFFPQLGSDYRFNQVSFDFRQYFPVLTGHVLAFQEYIHSVTGTVPFQRMPILGGPWQMRGYILGRFRDNHSMALQAEYRMPLVWKLGMVGFICTGSVAESLQKLRLGEFKWAGGVGIRFRLKEEFSTNVRLDFGFARGSFGVYAMINEAF